VDLAPLAAETKTARYAGALARRGCVTVMPRKREAPRLHTPALRATPLKRGLPERLIRLRHILSTQNSPLACPPLEERGARRAGGACCINPLCERGGFGSARSGDKDGPLRRSVSEARVCYGDATQTGGASVTHPGASRHPLSRGDYRSASSV